MPYSRLGAELISPRIKRRYKDMRKAPVPRRQEDRDERRARSKLAPRTGLVFVVRPTTGPAGSKPRGPMNTEEARV